MLEIIHTPSSVCSGNAAAVLGTLATVFVGLESSVFVVYYIILFIILCIDGNHFHTYINICTVKTIIYKYHLLNATQTNYYAGEGCTIPR